MSHKEAPLKTSYIAQILVDSSLSYLHRDKVLLSESNIILKFPLLADISRCFPLHEYIEFISSCGYIIQWPYWIECTQYSLISVLGWVVL